MLWCQYAYSTCQDTDDCNSQNHFLNNHCLMHSTICHATCSFTLLFVHNNVYKYLCIFKHTYNSRLLQKCIYALFRSTYNHMYKNVHAHQYVGDSGTLGSTHFSSNSVTCLFMSVKSSLNFLNSTCSS